MRCQQPHGSLRHLRPQVWVPLGALGGTEGRDFAQQRRCRLLIAEDGQDFQAGILWISSSTSNVAAGFHD